MSAPEELTLEFDFERNVFGAGEDRVIIGCCADPDQTVVKGKAPANSLEHGLTYRFYGYWATHPRYGRQFVFSSFVLATPAGERGTIAYLQRCRGVGKKRAIAIWAAFGPQALDVLKENPQEVARQVNGLTPAACEAARDYFRSIESLEKVTIELTELIGNRGFSRNLQQQVLEKWGNRAPEVIRENPYCLMVFKRAGFVRTDKLYLELGKDPGAIERQKWCIVHALTSDSNGHTWYPIAFAKKHLEKNIAGAEVKFNAALTEAVEEGLIVRRGGQWIAETEKATAEARLASFVHQTEAGQTATQWLPVESCGSLSDHQREQLSLAFRGRLGILGGRPGTGKTYTLAAVIRALKGRRIAVAAPTGKAAVRATESLQAAGIDFQATTIHRLLGVEPVDGGWRFLADEEHPLPFDFVFVDEFSMCDTPLATSLLAACPPGCHVLLVGDPGQLSPVGHGAPLRDLMAAGIPHGVLTEIRRNSGRIVSACKSIAESHTFEPSPALDLDAGENLVWVERSKPEQQISELRSFLDQLRSSKKYDAVWDCQIVVPVNEKSPLARKKLNRELQGFLNPSGKQAKGNPFKVDDKIICTRNGYLPARDKGGRRRSDDEEKKHFVANGELAQVIESHPRFTVAKLSAPDRLVTIPRGVGDEKTDDTGCNWELGYVISTHKSQGSEWPIVVVMIDAYPGAQMLVDRHWIYTALSRGKDFVVGIGQLHLARQACRKSHMWARKTFLRESIEELRAESIGRAWDTVLV